MLSKFASILFFITFSLLIILISVLTQKSQCIDSSLVEKITFSDQTEVVSCSIQSIGGFSRKYETEKLKWEKEILAFENWLYLYWPKSSSKVKIKFFNEPQIPQKIGQEIHLWNEYSLNSWAIKKLLTESILEEKIKDNFARSFIADLYVRIWSQNQMIGYGDLTSYFSFYWWQAYNNLSTKNKIHFLKELRTLANLNPQNQSHYDLLNWLKVNVENEQKFTQFKKELNLISKDHFYDLSARFDFLLMVESMSKSTLEQMDKMQKRFPTSKIGVWDGKVLYHVPSQSYLSSKAFRQIEAEHYVWEICEDIEFRLLSSLPAQARKVLLVKNCGIQNLNVYASYIGGRTEKFAASNPKAEFILFDVPSLMTQKDLFINEIKVFSLLSKRAEFSDFTTKLGWQGVEVDEKIGVFIPKSSVEAIQYFRVKNESL